MLVSKMVQVRWYFKTREHYESILDINGEQKYKFTKMGDYFQIDIEDAHKGMTNRIDILCDYCGAQEERIYSNWRTHYDKSPIKKDACKNCRGKKTAESNLMKYGTTNVMNVRDVREKQERTNLKRYGFKNVAQSEKVKEKAKAFNLDKYGAEYYFQTDDFKDKYKEIMQEKYGVDNAFQAEEVKKKSKETMIEKWGVEHNMQNPQIRAKAVQTMYEKGSTPTSKPQIYLQSILGGELNYPFERYNLDIAFPEEKIAVEYDGGAHDLKVTLGGITPEEFKQREIIRSVYLKRDGWKLITIKSKKDSLPETNVLLKMIRDAKDIFSLGRSWVNFCIDSETIEYKNTSKGYDYDNLLTYRKVKKIMNERS